MKNAYVIGAGGHGRVITSIIQKNIIQFNYIH